MPNHVHLWTAMIIDNIFHQGKSKFLISFCFPPISDSNDDFVFNLFPSKFMITKGKHFCSSV